MKILHTSDWHLGRTLHRADLTPAFEQWADFLVSTVRERAIDAVLISGDVYDRGIPPVSMVNLLSSVLARLSELCHVVITSGNHDSPQRLGFGRELMRKEITLCTDSHNAGQPVYLPADDGTPGALVYPIPYLEPDVERKRLAPEDGTLLPRSHEAVVNAAMERIEADILARDDAQHLPRIVMAHAFVVGAQGSQSEQDIRVGGVDSVPSRIFDRRGPLGEQLIDYVALGHLHGPQRTHRDGEPIMRYSGSPVAFSFSEEHHRKSCVLLEFERGSREVYVELIEAPVYKPLRTIRGTLDELLGGKYAEHSNSFIRAYVTDSERPPNLFAQLRKEFPHILEVIHEHSGVDINTRQIEQAQLDPLELITEFFTANGGRDLTATELSLISSVWEKTICSEKESDLSQKENDLSQLSQSNRRNTETSRKKVVG